jgi:anti-sigma B factor antagonist
MRAQPAGSPVTAFAIDGELTIYRAAELQAALAQAIAGPDALALDLSGVTDIDGAGVQLLLAAKKSAPALTVQRPSPAVLEAFELLDLLAHFGSAA